MELILTGDTVKDIVNNINRGIIFVFWSNEKVICYHNCKRGYIIPTESVVYADCRESPEFISTVFPQISKQMGVNPCCCNIKGIIRTKAKFGRVTVVKMK